MTLLSPSELARCVGARDLDRLQAHVLAGGDPNAKVLPPGRLPEAGRGLWTVGDRLLHASIFVGWPEGTQVLLNAGADPEALSTGPMEVRTPLGRALQVNGPWENARHPALAEATPGSWAAMRRARQGCLVALLAAGARPDRPVDGGEVLTGTNAPVTIALAHRLFDAWVLLGQQGVPLDAPPVNGRSPLAPTVQEGRLRWVAHWLAAGLDANTVIDPAEGYTALHLGCRSHHPEAPRVIALLVRHADLNRADVDGDRPLHLAMANVKHGAVLVELLLTAGADPEQRNHHGLSPAQRSEDLLRDNPVHPVAQAFQRCCLTQLADTATAQAWPDESRPATRGRRRF